MNDKEEPPSNKVDMGIRAGDIPPTGALARRLKGIRTLWSSDWDIPVTRGVLSYRCLLISTALSKEG